MYDTIIIGAGMSGLAAGIRLAYYDQRICIVERHYTIGGLNSFYRLNRRDHDVGLHAVTNYTPKGTKKGPLARILRQLRFRWDEFELRPQVGSEIAFPDVRLNFGNGLTILQSEIADKFPAEIDRFRNLLGKILDYDDLDQETFDLSARKIVSETIHDPLLVEMLFCPLMWYGNAREHDMDFGQFCVMFRSVYMEGFARPMAGVRLILKNLVRKFRALGGELKLRTGVDRIQSEDGRATGVVLDDGTELSAKQVISSAGYAETMRMCDEPLSSASQPGVLTFTESISVLDRQPKQVDNDRTIVFYNDSEKFHWERSEDLCDLRTGVICSPNNYLYESDEGELSEGFIRITSIANFDHWSKLSEQEYRLEKLRWYDRIVDSAVRFVPDFRGWVIDTDMFTPTTIRRYTGHENGAVYGAPKKQLDGATHLENLYLCGTDQGFVGIIGSMFSGLAIANNCLQSEL